MREAREATREKIQRIQSHHDMMILQMNRGRLRQINERIINLSQKRQAAFNSWYGTPNLEHKYRTEELQRLEKEKNYLETHQRSMEWEKRQGPPVIKITKPETKNERPTTQTIDLSELPRQDREVKEKEHKTPEPEIKAEAPQPQTAKTKDSANKPSTSRSSDKPVKSVRFNDLENPSEEVLDDEKFENESDIEIVPAPTPPIPEVVDLGDEDSSIAEPENEDNDDDMGIPDDDEIPDMEVEELGPPIGPVENTQNAVGRWIQNVQRPRVILNIAGDQLPRITRTLSLGILGSLGSVQLIDSMARPPPPPISPMSSTTTSGRSTPLQSPSYPDPDPGPSTTPKKEPNDGNKPFKTVRFADSVKKGKDEFKSPQAPSGSNSPFAKRPKPSVYAPKSLKLRVKVGPKSKVTKRSSVLGKNLISNDFQQA